MGDLGATASRISEIGELLVERAGVEPGMEVLDVGTGPGNAALPAAKRGARVIGLDGSQELLAVARERAADAMVEIDWAEGSVEALPFDDDSFDRVLSAFGHTSVPEPERAAAELRRVCRPRGVVAVCGWTGNGVVRELLGDGAADVQTERRHVTFDGRPGVWEYVIAVVKL